jgi:iron complex transport system ATP-binding protein
MNRHGNHERLSVNGVSVRYGKHQVLSGINLPDLNKGELTVFAGPNGAGKSTLLRAIAGIVRTDGSIRLGAVDLLALSARERAHIIGFLPQLNNATSRLTVLDSIIASLRLFAQSTSLSATRRKACATLERLGILNLAMTPLNELSGGQRQLAMLSQSLAREPHVLLLDEPTSALDVRHQFEVMHLLRSLAKEGRIVVAVLHDITLAANWADEFIFMQSGKVVASGSTQDVLSPTLLSHVFGVRALVQPNIAGGRTITISGLAESDSIKDSAATVPNVTDDTEMGGRT